MPSKHDAELENALAQVRVIGAQMSNLCYNLGRQSGMPISERNAEIMRELQVQWDQSIYRYSTLLNNYRQKADRDRIALERLQSKKREKKHAE